MKTHGGKRENSGQKLKYDGPTTTIAFRVPLEKVGEIKQLVNAQLEQYKVSKN